MNYLQKGPTINGEKYAKFPKLLRKVSKKKHPDLKGSGFIKTMIQHPSPWFQWLLRVTMVLNWTITLLILWFDYYLFLNIKEYLPGNQYRSNDHVVFAVDDFFYQ